MFKKISLVSILVLLVVFATYAYYQFALRASDLGNAELVDFVVEPGANVETIANSLADKGIISSARVFKFYVWQSESASKLQAGQYRFGPGMPVADIVERLKQGNVVNDELNIKILEGWTIDDIDEYLAKEGIAEKGAFATLAKASTKEWNLDFARPGFIEGKDTDLEGYLFPDTYRIFKDASLDEIAEKMIMNLDRKLDSSIRAEIERQGKSLHEILTMASIIEKEVRTETDAAVVSGILYKRMASGMRLEVDSTINYITGKNDPGAKYEDLAIDSPYNTYKNDGLPPGPICNPGLWAIKAAIYPKESPYFFYLNRQDTGETIFSKDFAEHVRNKNKYLR